MNRLQWIVTILSVGLFVLLYFGLDVKTDEQQRQAAVRSANLESTDINILKREASDVLSTEDKNRVRVAEQELSIAEADSAKVAAHVDLSGLWYRLQQPAIAGYHAQEVAQLENTEEAWSIAGTTYAICVQRAESDKVRQFCTNRAFKAFENAISINPDNVQHQVNLALTYLETENPMTGIQLLLNLNQQHPQNVLVLATLGEQAIRSNQLDKAVERFLQVVALEPNHQKANCTLASLYQQMQQPQEAQLYQSRCKR
jgi:predicted Zn-dependent protease